MSTLYEELLRLRDEDRERRKNAVVLVKGKELPWERNPQGKMKWYLHPSIQNTALKTFLLYEQEIPPGGRSGRQRYQGGQVLYVLEGRGYTVIDGVRYDWEEGDVVQLPLKAEGIVYQHFNADRERRARLLACEPNLIGAVGVDRGSGFEQLEDAQD